jgi:hypothetical protein
MNRNKTVSKDKERETVELASQYGQVDGFELDLSNRFNGLDWRE